MISRLCCCFPEHRSSPETGSKVNDGSLPATSKTDPASSQKKVVAPPKGFVLVEHFTSQGLSDCPGSDLFISRLGQGDGNKGMVSDVPVVVLSYHVGHWDHHGWKDPFASSFCDVRHKAYAETLRQDSIYAPEVVVQGRAHSSGIEHNQVLSLIASASHFPTPDVRVTLTKAPDASTTATTLDLSVVTTLKFKIEGSLDVLVALFENGLVTDCSNGANKGRVLTNDFVVRGLEKAASVQDWPAKKTIKGQVSFQLWQGYSKSKCGMAVIFQNPLTMEVYGAKYVDFPGDA